MNRPGLSTNLAIDPILKSARTPPPANPACHQHEGDITTITAPPKPANPNPGKARTAGFSGTTGRAEKTGTSNCGQFIRLCRFGRPDWLTQKAPRAWFVFATPGAALGRQRRNSPLDQSGQALSPMQRIPSRLQQHLVGIQEHVCHHSESRCINDAHAIRKRPERIGRQQPSIIRT